MISLRTVLFVLFLIIFVETLATIGNWYWIVPWLDIPMHFAGGIGITLLFFCLDQKYFKINGKIVRYLSAISFTVFIGVLWEFWEYIYSVLSPSSIFSVFKFPANLYRDTLGDLFFDLLGALFFCVLYFLLDVIKYNHERKI